MNQATERRNWLPFVGLELTTTVSGMGNGISMIVFPWLALELTGSPSAAGAMAAIAALPMLLSFFFSGVAVDILGRRPVSVGSDLLSLLSVAMVPVLGYFFGLSFGMLAALAVCGAIFDPAGMSARESMVPEAARAAGLSLERGNGINEAFWGVAYLAGPALGGASIGFLGAERTCWLSAGLFLVGAITMTIVKVPGSARPPTHERPSGIWASTKEGISFLFADRLLRTIALISAVVVGFWLPVEGVILPVYFQQTDSPERLGFTAAAIAFGGITGAALYSYLGERFNRRRIFISALIICSAGVIGMALLPPYPIFLVMCFLVGLTYGPIPPIVSTELQERSPSRLRGRVMGINASAEYVAGPIGYVIAGPLIEAVGLGNAFLIMAIGFAAVSLLTIGSRALRGMGTSASQAESPETVATEGRSREIS